MYLPTWADAPLFCGNLCLSILLCLFFFALFTMISYITLLLIYTCKAPGLCMWLPERATTCMSIHCAYLSTKAFLLHPCCDSPFPGFG